MSNEKISAINETEAEVLKSLLEELKSLCSKTPLDLEKLGKSWASPGGSKSLWIAPKNAKND